MDPLLDYYLCTKNGETIMVAAYGWEEGVLEEYDSVQLLPYWRALQLTVALVELERTPTHLPDLFPLTAFMDASEERIEELFESEHSG